MKYINIIGILLLLIIFASCDNSTEPTEVDSNNKYLSIDWSNENSVVCLGTSITKGDPNYDDSTMAPDSSYPGFLGQALKLKVYNEGVWGAKATNGLITFKEKVLDEKPCLILLEFGGNEFLQGYPVERAEIGIDTLIKEIKLNNIKVVLLSFINPDMLNHTPEGHFLLDKADEVAAYYEMLKNLAVKNDIPFVDYIYKDIWGKSELMSHDEIHPNNLGNVQLEKNVMDSLYFTFKNNGMLK